MLLTTKAALRPMFGWLVNQPIVVSFLYIFTDDPIYYYQGIALPLAACSILSLIPFYQSYEKQIVLGD
jgi:hypothetical protein